MSSPSLQFVSVARPMLLESGPGLVVGLVPQSRTRQIRSRRGVYVVSNVQDENGSSDGEDLQMTARSNTVGLFRDPSPTDSHARA